MRRVVLVLLFALPLFGADFEIGARHVGTTIGGDTGILDVATSRGFGASAELFWTESLSTQASITLINPAASAGDTDLGTLGMTTYAATARWHIAPHRRLSGYAGGGVALVQLGNLDDQFADDVDVVFDDETAFIAEAGLRWRARPRLFFEAGATYVPLDATPHVRKSTFALPDQLTLDPWSLVISASWRF